MTISRLTASVWVVGMVLCCVLSACSSSPRFVRSGAARTPAESSTPPSGGKEPAGGSVTVLPNNGKVLLTLEGVASYYADDFNGKLTSNGETFNMNDLTAANRTLPFGTRVRVTNLGNGKTVIVRVNDRGPYVEGRLIDLSLGAAKRIDLIQTGTARVKLEVLQWGDGK